VGFPSVYRQEAEQTLQRTRGVAPQRPFAAELWVGRPALFSSPIAPNKKGRGSLGGSRLLARLALPCCPTKGRDVRTVSEPSRLSDDYKTRKDFPVFPKKHLLLFFILLGATARSIART
jgi:hypothetical protein